MTAEPPWSDHPLDRRAAARDCWPGSTLAWWQGQELEGADRVWWPRTSQEVAEVLRRAEAAGVTVVPFGAGSGVGGGARVGPGQWALDLKRLSGLGPVDEARRVVEVEAGVLGQHLEDWLAERGWTCGHSPSSIGCSTVGGWAAARGAGQFSSRYGVFEDIVLGMEVVTPRGVFRLGEGGDGDPSLWPMFLGSEGTLGVITRLWLRVWPLAEERWLRGYRFASMEAAVTTMRELMQAELWPAVLRLYDPVDTRIGGKTRPKKESSGETLRWLREVADRPGLKERSLALPLGLPWLVNRLLDGLASGALLVVGFEGSADVVAAAVRHARPLLEARGEDLGPEPGERWFHSRHAVSYRLMPIFERGGFADTMEVACRWSKTVELYEAVRSALRPYAVVMAHLSHLYPEGASIYFSFAGLGDQRRYDEVWTAALGAVQRVGATVTHHHGVGRLKARHATAEVGAAILGWRAAKERLDPAGVLNPGVLFVPGEPEAHTLNGWAEVDGVASVGQGRALWPWSRLPGLPSWQRCPWQTSWYQVAGRVGGEQVVLGRGPRSACGPDLRDWLYRHGEDVQCAWPIETRQERWFGVGRPPEPWRVAFDLLRADLRPATLTVVDGELRVGFRGPAAEAFGRLAQAKVPGGLVVSDWVDAALPAGPLVPCTWAEQDISWVNLSGPYRPAVMRPDQAGGGS